MINAFYLYAAVVACNNIYVMIMAIRKNNFSLTTEKLEKEITAAVKIDFAMCIDALTFIWGLAGLFSELWYIFLSMWVINFSAGVLFWKAGGMSKTTFVTHRVIYIGFCILIFYKHFFV